MEVLIASKNRDKIEEIRSILNFPNMCLLSLDDFPGVPEIIEDGNSLYENALKKASVCAEFTGLPTVSDDTGLEVDALDGSPGIVSARYAGERASYEENVKKLLSDMSNVPEDRRTAKFRCVAIFYHSGGIVSEEGAVEGIILDECRGAGGFGYDPVFFITGKGKTFAEMSQEEKNAISHRGKAFRKLHERIKECLMGNKYQISN